MTFFERQEAARRNTARLVILMLLAVLGIVVVVNAILCMAFAFSSNADEPVSLSAAIAHWLHSEAAIWSSLAILAVIAAGSLRSMLSLRGGGASVAKLVGATPVEHDSKDPAIRRLVNVLDEMSIASGTPRPALYVLEQEQGINAFVAGDRPSNAVMVVTRGALNQLTRDELQGVVGHEFSHILNGDIRLNIRLIGLLAGILMIGQFGRLMMYSGRGRSRGNDGRILLAGLAIFLIGVIGTFFGGLIKAAVSRQREFLADAASVQFTRNPDGIAGALWKIGRLSQGSALINKHNDDISHLCFGDSIGRRWSSLTATHPPIAERIAVVHPRFEPPRDWTPRTGPEVSEQADGPSGQQAPAGIVTSGLAGSIAAGRVALTAESLRGRLGSVTPQHLDAASNLLRTLPAQVVEAAHHPETARALIYALLMPQADSETWQAARTLIAERESDAMFRAAATLVRALDGAGAGVRLPLINLAMPVLAQEAEATRKEFLATSLALIHADSRYTLSEFALQTVMEQHLGAPDRALPVRHYRYQEVESRIRLLLSILAYAGAEDASRAQQAFAKAMHSCAMQPGQMLKVSDCTPSAIREALQCVRELAPMRKESVLGACAECVVDDGTVTPLELELLQAIALSFDAPMPPVLAGDLRDTSTAGQA